LVVEQDSAACVDSVRLAVVPGHIKSGDFADSIRRSRMKAGRFVLRNLLDLSEHFAGPREVKMAGRYNVLKCCENKMRTIDVRLESGKLIVEGIAHEALSREMIAFVQENFAEDLIDAREAFERGRVKLDAVEQMRDAAQAPHRIFQGDAPHQSMYFIALGQQ